MNLIVRRYLDFCNEYKLLTDWGITHEYENGLLVNTVFFCCICQKDCYKGKGLIE